MAWLGPWLPYFSGVKSLPTVSARCGAIHKMTNCKCWLSHWWHYVLSNRPLWWNSCWGQRVWLHAVPNDTVRRPTQSQSEARFNTCRVRIEMTFEVIKARWNCLCGLRVKPERASQIITACVVLHNIATIRKERAPHVPLVADYVVYPITVDHATGTAVRRAISNQVFGYFFCFI